jgi:hypothetical protein
MGCRHSGATARAGAAVVTPTTGARVRRSPRPRAARRHPHHARAGEESSGGLTALALPGKGSSATFAIECHAKGAQTWGRTFVRRARAPNRLPDRGRQPGADARLRPEGIAATSGGLVVLLRPPCHGYSGFAGPHLLSRRTPTRWRSLRSSVALASENPQRPVGEGPPPLAWSDYVATLTEEYRRLLSGQPSEHDTQRLFELNPALLPGAFLMGSVTAPSRRH